MTRHDGPNAHGFAGDSTPVAPEPPPPEVPEEAEEAEPGSDRSREFREALADSDLDEE